MALAECFRCFDCSRWLPLCEAARDIRQDADEVAGVQCLDCERDLYDEATVERLIASAEEQGFPRQCSDPAVLARIADALRSNSHGCSPSSGQEGRWPNG